MSVYLRGGTSFKCAVIVLSAIIGIIVVLALLGLFTESGGCQPLKVYPSTPGVGIHEIALRSS